MRAALAFPLPIGLHAFTEPGRRTQCFAVIEHREASHVGRDHAAVGLPVDDDGDGAAFDPAPESDLTSAREPGS